jgi:hypothetical protein
MSDLFKAFVNGTEQEQEDRKHLREQSDIRKHQRRKQEEQERLDLFPKLVHQKRKEERLRAELERRKQEEEYNKLSNKIKRTGKDLWKFLWDL